MTRPKIGIVGFGRMGKVHFQSCRLLGLDVVAIVDPDTEGVAKFLEELEFLTKPNVYPNLAQMFEIERVDLLVIATTADLHHSIVISALRQPGIRQILCEKPISNNISDALEMVSACEEKNVALAVNHQMRYLPQYAIIQDFIASNKFGRFGNMVISGSNFGLGMNATHYFEAFRWITGDVIQEVSAWLDSKPVPSPRGAQFSDQSGALLARNSKGQNLFISFSQIVGHQVSVIYEFEFAKVQINEISGEVRIDSRDPEDYSQPTSRYGLTNHVEQLSIQGVELITSSSRVLNALINNENYPSGKDGLNSISAAFMAIQSAQSAGLLTTYNSLNLKETKANWA